jgi:hypothetical protein
MISNNENDPFPVMEQDGTLRLVDALYRDDYNDDAENHKEKVKMYEDGTFDLIPDGEVEDDDDDEEQKPARRISRLQI